MEEISRKQYLAYQQQMGNPKFTTQRVGLVISVDNPWIAASPDDRAIDSLAAQSRGIVEYKNPFSVRDLTLPEACDQVKSFCLEKQEEMGQLTYKLK